MLVIKMLPRNPVTCFDLVMIPKVNYSYICNMIAYSFYVQPPAA